MSSGNARIILPADLLQEIDELVGIGARTEFIPGLAHTESKGGGEKEEVVSCHTRSWGRYEQWQRTDYFAGRPPSGNRRTGRHRCENRVHPRPRTHGK